MPMQGPMPGNHDAMEWAERPSGRLLQAACHEDLTLPKVGSNREASRALPFRPVCHFRHLFITKATRPGKSRTAAQSLPKVGSSREASRALPFRPVCHFGHLHAAGAQAVAGLAKSLASLAGFPYSWNTKLERCVTCTLIQVFFCTYSNELICVECPGVREALGAVLGLVALDAFLFGGSPHV